MALGTFANTHTVWISLARMRALVTWPLRYRGRGIPGELGSLDNCGLRICRAVELAEVGDQVAQVVTLDLALGGLLQVRRYATLADPQLPATT